MMRFKGVYYEHYDRFEPDPSVGIFGEPGNFMVPDSVLPEDYEDDTFVFVTDDGRIYGLGEGFNNYDQYLGEVEGWIDA